MLFEYEFFSKDYIKLYFLNDVINNKTASFTLFLESDGLEKDFLDVRNPERSVYRFNNFNVSEDATNNCITFRPNVVGCYVYFCINSQNSIKIDIIKNGTNTVAQSFELGSGTSKIEFCPQSLKKYNLKIKTEQESNTAKNNHSTQSEKPSQQPESYSLDSDFSDFAMFGGIDNSVQEKNQSIDASEPVSYIEPLQNEFENSVQQKTTQTIETVAISDNNPNASSEELKRYERNKDNLERGNERLQNDISELEKTIAELEQKNAALINKKKSLTSHLDKLQKEYDKDYSSFNADAEEIGSRYTIDAEILRLYSGKNVEPIEELLTKAEEDIKKIEEQIKNFVEAQERKTAAIEEELKIGKMQ